MPTPSKADRQIWVKRKNEKCASLPEGYSRSGVCAVAESFPLRNPEFSVHVAPGIARSVTPFLLFALLPLNIVVLLLGESPLFYGTLLGLQILFYGMGYWGYYLSTRQIKNKVLFIPYYFLFMNVNVLKGIGYLKRKKGSGAWEKAKRAEK